MKKNTNPVKQTQGKKINTKWLNNVLKSIGTTAADEFKNVAPNLYDAGHTITTSVKDITQISKGNNVGNVGKKLKNNKYIGMAQKAFDNALEDLKSGNLNNQSREEEEMMEGFGFDDFGDFADDFGDDGASITFNYVDEGSSNKDDAIISVQRAVEKGAESNIKAQKAMSDAMISIASASMLQSQEIGKEITSHLGNINNGISSLLTYHQENTTKFYESALAVFDRFAKKQEQDEASKDNRPTSLFNSTGGIDFQSYKEYVKKSVKGNLKGTEWGAAFDMVLGDDNMLNMLVANPLSCIPGLIVRGIVPNMVTTTVKGIEEAFTGFVPTMLSKLSEWATNTDYGMAGSIKRFIGKAFGIKAEKLEGVDLENKVTKDVATFDGVTRNSIIEIIPKHLREMSSYLKSIAEHFGADSEKLKGKQEIFDNKKSKYITIDDLKKNIGTEIADSITSAFSGSEFGKIIQRGGSSLVGENSETYDRMVKQLYQFMTREKGAFDLSDFDTKNKDSKISNILGMIDTNGRQEEKVLDVLRQTINIAKQNNIGLHHAQAAKIQAHERYNDKIQELTRDYDLNNLISAGFSDLTPSQVNEWIDKSMGNKKSQEKREKEKKDKEKRKQAQDVYNNRSGRIRNAKKVAQQGLKKDIDEAKEQATFRNNFKAPGSDEASVPGFIQNMGGHARGFMFSIMNGNSQEGINQLGAIFSDSFKVMWNGVKDNFLTPLKDSLFGKKNDDGFFEGGLFSGVKNQTKDIWKEFTSAISGKNWKDSNGEIHEVNPEDSVVGKVKNIFTTISDSVKYKLFGNKDKDNEDEEGGGKKKAVVDGIIGSLKEGLLGWKTALFGEDPEKSQEEMAAEFKDKAIKAIPDLGVGALGGLAVSHFSGGLLGAMIGGPVGGIILGMGTSLLARSSKFQDYLFGPEVEDENGNKSRIGGLISKKTQDMFKDSGMKKSVIGGATLGLVKSMIFQSSGGFLGALVGGPIAGAMFGAGMGIITKSEMFKKFMYGDEEKGTEGFKNKIIRKIKEIFGKKDNEDGEEGGGLGAKIKKSFSMGAIGAAGGGIMGLMLGGPIIGALAGLGAGIAASGSRFKKFMFGEKDKDGNKIKEGLVGKFGNFVHVEILAPMKSGILNITDDFKLFLKHRIFKKVEILAEPLIDGIKGALDHVKQKGKDFVGMVTGRFVKPIVNLAKKTVFDPIKKTIGFVAKLGYRMAKRTIALPVKILTGITKLITSPFVKAAKKIGEAAIHVKDAIKEGVKSAFKTVLGPIFRVGRAGAKWVGNKIKSKAAKVRDRITDGRTGVMRGLNAVRKAFNGESFRTQLTDNEIEYRDAKKQARQDKRDRNKMDKNRALVAKTLGYDVKYFTEETMEEAMKKNKWLTKSDFKGIDGEIKFEKDPEKEAEKRRQSLLSRSGDDLANSDINDLDIDERHLVEETRQTGILERILRAITGKGSPYGDDYASDDETDDSEGDSEGSSDGNNDPDKDDDKKDDKKDDNKDGDGDDGDEGEGAKREGWRDLYDELNEKGLRGTIKDHFSNFKEKFKNTFSLGAIKDGWEHSELKEGIHKVKGAASVVKDMTSDAFGKVKGLFGKFGRARAEGGDIEENEPYLVGDGGSDPSAAEIVVPKTAGKVLSQKDGGIKVVIEDFSKKAKKTLIEADKEGSKEGSNASTPDVSANSYQGQKLSGKLKNSASNLLGLASFIPGQQSGSDDDSDNSELAKASASANAEPEYDESGNLVQNQVDTSSFSGIKDADDKKEAIKDVDNATDLENAKNKNSYLSQKAKKDALKESADKEEQKGMIQKAVDHLKEGNEDRKKHFFDWSSIFSKKGLITGAVLAGGALLMKYFPEAAGLIKDIISALGPIAAAVLKFLGNGVGDILSDFIKHRDDHTNGGNEATEAERIVDNYKDGNILQLGEDGEATMMTGATERFIGRRGVNILNRNNVGFGDKILNNKLAKNTIGRTKAGKFMTAGAKEKAFYRKVESGAQKVANSKVGQKVGAVKDKAKNAIKDGASKVVDKGKDAAKSVGNSLKSKADDVASAVTEKAGKDDGILSKVAGYVDDFFKFISEKVAERCGGKIANSKLFKVINANKIMKGLKGIWGKVMGKFAALITAKVTVAGVTVGVSELVFTISGAVDGASGAAQLFQIDSDAVDGTMITIASIMGALRGTTVGSVVDLVFSVLGPIFQINIFKTLACSIYEAIKGFDSEASKNLEQAQADFEGKYEEFKNNEYKQQYEAQKKAGIIGEDVTYEQFVEGVHDEIYKVSVKSFEDYNVDEHKAISDHITGAIGGAVTSAGDWLHDTFVQETKKRDKNGNIYTPSSGGKWKVTDKDGNDLGEVAEDAVPEDAEDISEKKFFGHVGDAISDGASWVGSKFSEFGDTVSGAVGAAKDTLGSWGQNVAEFAGGAFTDRVDGWKQMTAGAADKFKNEGFVSGIKEVGKGLWNATLGANIKDAKRTFNAIKDVAGTSLDGVKNTAKKLFTDTEETIYRDIADNTYYKKDGDKWYHYNVSGDKLSEDEVPQEELDQLILEGKVKEEKITNKADVKEFGEKVVNAVKDKVKSAKDKVLGWLGIGKKDDEDKKEEDAKKDATKDTSPDADMKKDKDYIFRSIDDNSFYYYTGDGWYHFTAAGEKMTEEKIDGATVADLFHKGKLTKELMNSDIKEKMLKLRSEAFANKMGISNLLGKGTKKSMKAVKSNNPNSAKKSNFKSLPNTADESKYAYYMKSDKSYYACIGGKWYHFNKEGQKVDEKEVSLNYIKALFLDGKVVKVKMEKELGNDAEAQKFIKDLVGKKNKGVKWESAPQRKINPNDEKEKGSKKSKKSKSVYMSKDGDYYEKNKDGGYDHYSALGDFIGTSNEKEKVDEINKQIKNGSLIPTNKPRKQNTSQIKNGILSNSNSNYSNMKAGVKYNAPNEEPGRKSSSSSGGFFGSIKSFFGFGEGDEDPTEMTGDDAEKTQASQTDSTQEDTSSTTTDIFSKISEVISNFTSKAMNGLITGNWDSRDSTQSAETPTTSTATTETPSTETSEIGGAGEKINGFTYYSQKDKKWRNKKYSSGKAKGTMGKAGCGPTALSMVASELTGREITPTKVAEDAVRGGFRDHTGTNSKFINYEAKKYNLSTEQEDDPSASYISSEVGKGHPLILNGVNRSDDSSPYTKAGHYVVAVGKDRNGRILINDPRSKRKSRAVSPKKLARETRAAWSFDRRKRRRNKGGRGGFGGNGENTFTAADVINVAKSEVGYCEKASNKDLDDPKANAGKANFTKFAPYVGHSNGNYWCATFVVYCFVKAANGDKEKAKEVLCGANTAGCIPNANAFKKAGRFDKNPQPGDVIIFTRTGGGHTGIVIEVNGDDIKTIEGNTSSKAFDANGGAVCEKSYNMKSISNLLGFGHPKYDGESTFSGVNQAASTDGSADGTQDANAEGATQDGAQASADASGGDFFSKVSQVISDYSTKAMNGLITGNWDTQVSTGDTASTNTDDTADQNAAQSDSSDAAVADIPGSDTVEKIWNYFKGQGYSDAAVAGILGNAKQESGINPKSGFPGGPSSGGPAKGIWQMEGGRLTAMKNFAKKNNLPEDSAEAQMQYLGKELKDPNVAYFGKKATYGSNVGHGAAGKTNWEVAGTEMVSFDEWKNGTDPDKTTRQFEAALERASWPRMENRVKYAKEFYKKYKGTGGSGGFGDDECDDSDVFDFDSSYNTKYFLSGSQTGSSSLTSQSTTPSLSGDDAFYNALGIDKSKLYSSLGIQEAASTEQKMQEIMEKMVTILEKLSDSSTESNEYLKNIATNTKGNRSQTNFITNNSNNLSTNSSSSNTGSLQMGESRNSMLARQLARG